ncbi:hypothetical protein C7212DRAFT_290078 [Tuber magnatum]|uniref:Uncharacterized protein n=1 Tax=Tuber magnatum TaxID=42249 RepID=A0A317SZT7_9PEZI|nr:hypothetical protein C7212DRAFT_290078 [Tuber magnatum]
MPLNEDIRLRREALFRAGLMLTRAMDETAWNPGNLMVGMAIHKNPSITVVKAVKSSEVILNEAAVSDNILRKMDPVNDLQPLANIHNTLLQLGALITIKQELYDALQNIKLRLQELQANMTNNIGQAMAEVHDFICFVTFVNLIHPQNCILTSESIKNAEILASKSIFSEARQAFVELRQAYDLQTPVPGYRLSKARELPAFTSCIMEQWHRGYSSHTAKTGIEIIPFHIIFGWWINYQRKFISSAQEKTTPIVEKLISQAYISKSKMPEDEAQQPWMQEDKDAFKAATNLAMSMTILCKNIPFPEHVKPNPLRERQLPIYTHFEVDPQNQPICQELQKLLAQIYELFEKNSCNAFTIMTKAYYTKVENYIKCAIRDQKTFSVKHLNAATYFFNSLRQVRVVVLMEPSEGGTGQDKVEVPLLDAVSKVCRDPTITDEEKLAAITCKSLPQVGMHFLINYRKHVPGGC